VGIDLASRWNALRFDRCDIGTIRSMFRRFEMRRSTPIDRTSI
jgi:hypothetical protein